MITGRREQAQPRCEIGRAKFRPAWFCVDNSRQQHLIQLPMARYPQMFSMDGR